LFHGGKVRVHYPLEAGESVTGDASDSEYLDHDHDSKRMFRDNQLKIKRPPGSGMRFGIGVGRCWYIGVCGGTRR